MQVKAFAIGEPLIIRLFKGIKQLKSEFCFIYIIVQRHVVICMI